MNTDRLNSYNSIIPSEMTNRELKSICTDIQTAINWGLSNARVYLNSTQTYYKVDVNRLKDYQDEYRTEIN